MTGTDRDAYDELDDWVERFLATTHADEWRTASLRAAAYRNPPEAAADMLCGYVVGRWDLSEEDLAALWLVGRKVGGTREELITDYALERAAPGRAVRPEDPPGRWPRPFVLLSGGHGPGRRKPGKREFPSTWEDERVLQRGEEVARQPSGAVELPYGMFRAWGERDGVLIGVVVAPDGELLTAYPITGRGVVQNPPDEAVGPLVQRLRVLLEQVPDPAAEPRLSLDELTDVGEWPHVLECLLVLDVPWTQEQREEIRDLSELSGVEVPEGFVS